MSKASEKRRCDILNAAAVEFSTRGIDGAAMADIAARAGIGKSTIYEYFPSKSALLAEVCKCMIDEMQQRVAEIFSEPVSFREKLINYCTVVVKHLETLDIWRIIATFIDYELANELCAAAENMFDKSVVHITAALKAAQESGEISQSVNTEVVGTYLFSAPAPNVVYAMRRRGVKDPIESIVDTLLNGLKTR